MAVNLGPVMWADPDELAVTMDISVSDAAESIRQASWVLWGLTARHFHAAGVRRDLFRMPSPALCVARPEIMLEGPGPDVTLVRTSPGTSAPVWTDLDTPAWYQIGRRLMVPAAGFGLAEVTYDVGSNLPPGTVRTTLVLAAEHAKARAGRATRLPDRITSVTRSGVSWTVFDPTDIIAKGKSGIPEIDAWLSLVNPLAQRRRAKITKVGQARRIGHEWVGVNTHDMVDDIP